MFSEKVYTDVPSFSMGYSFHLTVNLLRTIAIRRKILCLSVFNGNEIESSKRRYLSDISRFHE